MPQRYEIVNGNYFLLPAKKNDELFHSKKDKEENDLALISLPNEEESKNFYQ